MALSAITLVLMIGAVGLWGKLTHEQALLLEQELVQRRHTEAVQAEAAALPVEAQQAITAYLTQVPAMIRRSLRRPSDPTGTTVPATLSLSGPEDLAQFLPPRPPRKTCSTASPKTSRA